MTKNQRILAMYRKGDSIVTIMARFGLSRAQVNNIIDGAAIHGKIVTTPKPSMFDAWRLNMPDAGENKEQS